MRRIFPGSPAKLVLIFIAVLLLGLFAYVALRSGPMAPIPVTVAQVELRALEPGQFGVGTVEARYRYQIGPTAPGRLQGIAAEVGDRVSAGMLLAEMDPVDLGSRIAAREAALEQQAARAKAAQARVDEMRARAAHARQQWTRYTELAGSQAVSQETLELRRLEDQVAQASLATATEDLAALAKERQQIEADRQGLLDQRAHLRLRAPVDGLVVSRQAEAGSTLVAGETVLELVNPGELWIEARFDQAGVGHLRAGQPALIRLRSRGGESLAGRLLRMEPLADSVTEEALARVAFAEVPDPLPALGELAEVTVALPPLPPAATLPGASLRRLDGQTGVWVVAGNKLEFRPVRTGRTDLEGRVQILAGVEPGETVVVYSLQTLAPGSAYTVVDELATGRRL